MEKMIESFAIYVTGKGFDCWQFNVGNASSIHQLILGDFCFIIYCYLQKLLKLQRCAMLF